MTSEPSEVYDMQAKFLRVGLYEGCPLFVGYWWQDEEALRKSMLGRMFSSLGPVRQPFDLDTYYPM